MPYGWQRRGNQIIVQNAQDIHAGDYICSVTHQLGTTASDPGRLEIRKRNYNYFFKNRSIRKGGSFHSDNDH